MHQYVPSDILYGEPRAAAADLFVSGVFVLGVLLTFVIAAYGTKPEKHDEREDEWWRAIK
ncbi:MULTISPECIES: hypothetical protein [unclassified Bradyrhizobium]